MLEQLLERGILRRSSHGDLELAIPPGEIRFVTAGFGTYDHLDRAGDTWAASGWAFDPETRKSCLYAFALEDGVVATDVSFKRARRPDVNRHFQLDDLLISGFTVTFRPRPGTSQTNLVVVLPSGTLVFLPGPHKEILERTNTVLNPVPSLEPQWQALCADPVYAFATDSPFQGIYSFDSRFDAKSLGGVTEQFLEDAAVYHQKYTDHHHWSELLSNAFSRTGLAACQDAPLNVLEIGCGSGNTAIPLLKLLPRSRMIASDISPQLLAILRDHVSEADRRRLMLIAMDASQQHFAADSFDLVIGAAILHHILDPGDTIDACYHALKPGGRAIFFEPFEAGHFVLRLLFEQLLERRNELKLSPEVAEALRLIILDCDVRKGSDKSAEICALLDDKWLFTREYFEKEKQKHGFSGLAIHRMYAGAQRFSEELRNQVKLQLGAGPEAVSDEAWRFVREFESKMSHEVYSDLLIEGAVIFTK